MDRLVLPLALVISTSALFDGEAISEYVAQNGKSYGGTDYPMVIYESEHLYLVTPASTGSDEFIPWCNGNDGVTTQCVASGTYEPSILREILRRAEISWQWYANTTGRTIGGIMDIKDADGNLLPKKASIGIVPEHCGAACGALGAGSVETDLYYMDQTYRNVLLGWDTRGLIEYEFGRNYWVYDGLFQKDGDHWFHMATTFATVMGYLSGVEGGRGSWEYSKATGQYGGSCESPPSPDGCLFEWVEGRWYDVFIDQIYGEGGSLIDEASGHISVGGFNRHSIGGMWMWIKKTYGQQYLNKWFAEMNIQPSCSGNFTKCLANIMIATSKALEKDMYIFFIEYMGFPEDADAKSEIKALSFSAPAEFPDPRPALADWDYQASLDAGNHSLLHLFRLPAYGPFYSDVQVRVPMENGSYKLTASFASRSLMSDVETPYKMNIFEDVFIYECGDTFTLPKDQGVWTSDIVSGITHVEWPFSFTLTGECLLVWAFFGHTDIYIDKIRLVNVDTRADAIQNWDFNQAKVMSEPNTYFPNGKLVPASGDTKWDWHTIAVYFALEVVSKQLVPTPPWGEKTCACVNSSASCGCGVRWTHDSSTCDQTECMKDLQAAETAGEVVFMEYNLLSTSGGGYWCMKSDVQVEANKKYTYTIKFKDDYEIRIHEGASLQGIEVVHDNVKRDSEIGYTVETGDFQVTSSSCTMCNAELQFCHFWLSDKPVYYKLFSLTDAETGEERVSNPDFGLGVKGWYTFPPEAVVSYKVTSFAFDPVLNFLACGKISKLSEKQPQESTSLTCSRTATSLKDCDAYCKSFTDCYGYWLDDTSCCPKVTWNNDFTLEPGNVGAFYSSHPCAEDWAYVGEGHCRNGYLDGWNAADAADLDTCKKKCESEPNCKFISFLADQTCSRYSSAAGTCAAGEFVEVSGYRALEVERLSNRFTTTTFSEGDSIEDGDEDGDNETSLEVEFTTKTPEKKDDNVDEGENNADGEDETRDGESPDREPVEKKTTVKVTGSATLTVDDPASFIEDEAAKEGVKKAIAKQAGAEPEEVTVSFSLVESDGRRLATTVKVDFEIVKEVADADEASDMASTLSDTMASIDTAELAAEIIKQVEAAGGVTYTVTVSAFTAEEPVVETKEVEEADDGGDDDSTTGPTITQDSAGDRQAQVYLIGVFAVLQVFAPVA